MAFSRTAALRSCFRAARPTAARPQLWRHVARRGYASGAHGPAKGGDAIWAAGAVAVTLPSCYFILSQDTGAHHGDDHESHGEEHEEEESKEESSEEAESEEKPDEDGDKEEKTESTDESEKSDDSEKTEAAEKSDDSDSGDEKEADTVETSDDESDEPHKVGEDAKNVRKHVPDAKGGAKARLDSKAAITQGKPAEEADGPSDKPVASKEVSGNKNTMSGKQEGLSNTDTKHSTDISNDPNKSKKSEGGPDTAKVKGTVDPNRKAV